MKIQRTLLPGQAGTKKLVDQYGDNLLCVRYRYDFDNKQRLTTIELIIDRQNRTPSKSRTPPNKILNLKIEYGEKELAQQVKSSGGRWDERNKVWKLSYKYVRILQLEDRIVS